MALSTDQVQAISSVIGVIIAFVGFFFVSYQIRQISQNSRAGAHTAIFSHFLELDRLMLDKAEIRPYLCNGKALPSEDDPHYAQVILACEMFADFYEHVSLQHENLPELSRACWDMAMANRSNRNPALYAFLEKNWFLYAPALFASIERGKELLDKVKEKDKPHLFTQGIENKCQIL